ncbi:hypothetical protein [Desulforamulus aquiferis]|uniref:Uncharacterized protein n=1 Tax=Desulforamulus aquiferis TaxID=1397668 RepID=A0AAW7ZDS9_9FIRM|nr:hypothetical protein [Desulforamulus aquiferis]MDO7787868.1 hypothetical protein [Desulforamulus aquiferis]
MAHLLAVPTCLGLPGDCQLNGYGLPISRSAGKLQPCQGRFSVALGRTLPAGLMDFPLGTPPAGNVLADLRGIMARALGERLLFGTASSK